MKKIVFLITLWISIIDVYSQKSIKDLEYIDASASFTSYYAKIGSIKKVGNKTYKVWIYSYPQYGHEDECRNSMVNEHNNEKYSNFTHSVSLYNVDCNNVKIGTSKIIDYATNGEILFSSEYYTTIYSDVVPDTIGESIYEYVCKYVMENKVK